MKKKLRIFLRVVIVIAAAALLAGLLNAVLIIKRTDGITSMQNFYRQEEDTVDVLILGSSHAGRNFDAAALWDGYGISSYALWGSVQPFWNSYYFLREALEYQTPDVVVLDVYAATFGFEYSDEARQVTNVGGMRPSLNRVRAVMASAPRDRWVGLFLGLPMYHSRWSELGSDDFMHFPWSGGLGEDKGTSVRAGTGNAELPDVGGIDAVAPLMPKEEDYLRRIIGLCAERGIALELVTTPTVTRADEQPFYNRVQQIADECGIPYHNMNLMDGETGVTPGDVWTDDAHLNTEGAWKVSEWLGAYLADRYGLPDHRGDPAFAGWETFAREAEELYEGMIRGNH